MENWLFPPDIALMNAIDKKFQSLVDSISKTDNSLKQNIDYYEKALSLPVQSGISPRLLRSIYRQIISEAHSLVAPAPVAFLGPPGTFSHKAAVSIFGECADLLPQKTIQDVFREVEKGNAVYGVVPVENSTEGAVTFTLDELLETTTRVIAESYVRVSFDLLSFAESMLNIKKVFTHPQPYGQSKEWLAKNVPAAEVILVDSTTRAAELAVKDRHSAAISSREAADLYSLPVLSSGIEDSRKNYTRFFVIGNECSAPTGADKTSIVCAIHDRPSGLLNLLRPFSEAGINMTKIESRPDKKKLWAYNFFIDFIGHAEEEHIVAALANMRNETVYLKVLGSYTVTEQPH